jgi:hypothetical protein
MYHFVATLFKDSWKILSLMDSSISEFKEPKMECHLTVYRVLFGFPFKHWDVCGGN